MQREYQDLSRMTSSERKLYQRLLSAIDAGDAEEALDLFEQIDAHRSHVLSRLPPLKYGELAALAMDRDPPLSRHVRQQQQRLVERIWRSSMRHRVSTHTAMRHAVVESFARVGDVVAVQDLLAAMWSRGVNVQDPVLLAAECRAYLVAGSKQRAADLWRALAEMHSASPFPLEHLLHSHILCGNASDAVWTVEVLRQDFPRFVLTDEVLRRVAALLLASEDGDLIVRLIKAVGGADGADDADPDCWARVATLMVHHEQTHEAVALLDAMRDAGVARTINIVATEIDVHLRIGWTDKLPELFTEAAIRCGQRTLPDRICTALANFVGAATDVGRLDDVLASHPIVSRLTPSVALASLLRGFIDAEDLASAQVVLAACALRRVEVYYDTQSDLVEAVLKAHGIDAALRVLRPLTRVGMSVSFSAVNFLERYAQQNSPNHARMAVRLKRAAEKANKAAGSAADPKTGERTLSAKAAGSAGAPNGKERSQTARVWD